MFERFTDGARQVVVLAHDEARARAHPYIGSEHLLLGMLREAHGIAGHVLRSLDIGIDPVRANVGQRADKDAANAASDACITFTPHGKRALEMALMEALSQRSNSVGTEHQLLGVARFSDCTATLRLADFGVLDRIRPEVLRRLVAASNRDAITGLVPRSASATSPPAAFQNLGYGRHGTQFVDMMRRRVLAFRDCHERFPSVRVQLRDGEAFDLTALPEADEGMLVLQIAGVPRTIVLRPNAIARFELHDRESRLGR